MALLDGTFALLDPPPEPHRTVARPFGAIGYLTPGGVRSIDANRPTSERIAARVRCPLLDETGRCAIHPARPLACRSVTALEAGDCRAALAAGADPGDDDADGCGAPVVRMDLAQQALYLEALDALAGELARRGLDARRRDVSGMVGHFLVQPGALDAWLAGARVPLE